MFNYFGNQELDGAITISSTGSYANNYQSEGYGGRIYTIIRINTILTPPTDATHRHVSIPITDGVISSLLEELMLFPGKISLTFPG